jgi:hypothetical protein
VSDFSFDFEMTNTMISQAVREDCISLVKDHVKIRDVLIVLASSAIFARALSVQERWVWWITGFPFVSLLILVIVWSLAYCLLPGSAVRRLSHLPNRQVRVELSEHTLAFHTAAERLEVTWDELKDVKYRPNFWFFSLRSGTRIPIPAGLMTTEAVSLIETKLTKKVPAI